MAIVDGSVSIGRIARLVEDGIDFVQLREKSAGAGEVLALASQIVAITRGSRTRFLLNTRCDLAIAVGADGVHLTAKPGALTAAHVRALFLQRGLAAPLVSKSCHTIDDVRRAKDVDLILFGPVFEKQIGAEQALAGVGLERLRAACLAAGDVPVLALGGVMEANMADCLEAGAAGIAAIRLFA